MIVATVLTVYGIETSLRAVLAATNLDDKLQQYLPFTVLKRQWNLNEFQIIVLVATVLTVYGIETVLLQKSFAYQSLQVATVLTVYGIETLNSVIFAKHLRLQQYLPFTVLKRLINGEKRLKNIRCNSTYRLRY